MNARLHSWRLRRSCDHIFSRCALLLPLTILAAGVAAAPVRVPTADIELAAATGLVTIRLPAAGAADPSSMTDLHPADLSIWEDGVRQRDVKVTVEHLPVFMGVLFEHGGRYSVLNEIRAQQAVAAARQLLQEAGSTDKVVLWKYADHNQPVSDSTAPADLERSLMSLPTPGFSELNLYDAVIDALSKLPAVPGPKALMLISTGFDTFSKASLGTALQAARAAGVPIYIVNLGPIVRAGVLLGSSDDGSYLSLNWRRAESDLAQLAHASGGRVYAPESQLDLRGIYDELLAKLRIQYVIQYQPAQVPQNAQTHLVRIEARRSMAAHADVLGQGQYRPGATSGAHHAAS